MPLPAHAMKGIYSQMLAEAISESDVDSYRETISVDDSGNFEIGLDGRFIQVEDDFDWDISFSNSGHLRSGSEFPDQVEYWINQEIDDDVYLAVEEIVERQGVLTYPLVRKRGEVGLVTDFDAEPTWVGSLELQGEVIVHAKSFRAKALKMGYHSLKNHEMESVYEALQALLVQCSNGDMYNPKATDIAMAIYPPLAESEFVMEITDLLEGIDSIVFNNYAFDSYEFSHVIDRVLNQYEDELRDIN